MRQIPALLLFTFISAIAAAQFYDGSNMQFGKNRVQYDKFEWQYFRFPTYEIFFYTGGREVAIYASKAASGQISDVESFLEFYNHESIKYIIYNKYDHYRQSNIGIVDEQTNLGGVNKVIGTKVFLYFEGDHKKLEKDLRAGTAEVLLSNYLYGGDWRNVIRNTDMYKMPDWYFTGLVSYLSNEWDSDTRDRIKDGQLSGKFRKIVRLEGEEAAYAGHSVWKYIAETYGESVITNILFVTKINRDVESGFLYVLGITLKDLMKEWQAYMELQYDEDRLQAEMPAEKVLPGKTRKNRRYMELSADRQGRYFAYASNKKGKAKIYICDNLEKKKKKIFRHGIKLDRQPHFLYPQMAWHPSGEILAYVYQKKGKVYLNLYETSSGHTTSRNLFMIEDVLDLSYSDDGKQLTFSGVYEGQSDIYLYNIAGNSQKKITDDRFDDFSPIFTRNSKEILFASNRTVEELEHGLTDPDSSALRSDLFTYRIDARTTKLRRVTNSPGVSEMNPLGYRNGDVYFLSDENGIRNVYKTRFDSSIASVDTSVHYNYFFHREKLSDFKRNIRDFTSAGEEGSEVFLYRMKGRDMINSGSMKQAGTPDEVGEGTPDVSFEEKAVSYDVVKMQPYTIEKEFLEGEVDIHNYSFSEKTTTSMGREKKVIVFDQSEPAGGGGRTFELPQQRNYNLSFFRDQSILQINNTYLTQQYQKFGPPYQSPGVGVTMLLGISDLFEDHKIYGGLRLGSSSNEYMISYQNLKRRMDKEYFAGMMNTASEANGIEYRNRIIRGAVLLKYPFTEVSSLHMVLDGRRDRATPQARDITGLQAPITDDYWATYKMAYVYDNTRDKGINIKFGTRYKLFGEYYQQMNNQQVDVKVVGGDIRHYQPIHREMIFFSRFAASTSFGGGKLLYYLGGVDNWMATNRFDFDKPINTDDQNYYFQANATNMRGFMQNVRNGNSMAVVNTEMRWPVFRYFIRRPLRQAFLKNFQVVGFGDIGTAWTGPDPYSEANDQIREEISNGPLFITLKKSNEPMVASYGFGVRMALLGYFIRIDWAWGVENYIVQDRMVHFSLSLDL